MRTCNHATDHGVAHLSLGNYIQMMNVLRTIGFDVLECLSQLYDFYLHAVSELIQTTS